MVEVSAAPRRSPERNISGLAASYTRGSSADSTEDLSECIAVWGNRASVTQQASAQLRPSLDRASSSSVHARPYQALEVPSPPHVAATSSDAVPSTVVTLSVGGRLFMSSASTLRKAPYIDALLQQHFCHPSPGLPLEGAPTVDESTGHLFVDRSAELFSYVLEFLRSGRWLLGDRARDLDFVSALRDEAEFYGLHVDLPVTETVEYATVWQFRDDVSIYVDCGEQMIREDPDNQGLFRLCRYSGSLPLDQQSGTRRFKATSQGIQAVVSYFAMRGFSVTHVVEGSLLTHQTSADGQGRTGPAVQYVLSRIATSSEVAMGLPSLTRHGYPGFPPPMGASTS